MVGGGFLPVRRSGLTITPQVLSASRAARIQRANATWEPSSTCHPQAPRLSWILVRRPSRGSKDLDPPDRVRTQGSTAERLG